MRAFIKYNKNALLWAFLILLLCTMPVKGMNSFKLLDLLSFDKLVHAVLFAAQFWFLAIGQTKQHIFSYRRKNAITIAFIATVVYGGAIELVQGYLLSGRTMDTMDMIANIIGATIGAALFVLLKKKEKQRV